MEDLAGRVRDALHPDDRPSEDATILYALYALLVASKGEETSLRDVHDAWATWMALRGIEHESAIPFEHLSSEVQAEDQPFVDAIRRVAIEIGRGGDTPSGQAGP
jgi:LPS sulfotransferase NodH